MQTRREALFTGLAAAVAAMLPWRAKGAENPPTLKATMHPQRKFVCVNKEIVEADEYVWRVIYTFEPAPNQDTFTRGEMICGP